MTLNTGGSPEHLMQDMNSGLSKTLARDPNARQHARQSAKAIVRRPILLGLLREHGQMTSQQIRLAMGMTSNATADMLSKAMASGAIARMGTTRKYRYYIPGYSTPTVEPDQTPIKRETVLDYIKRVGYTSLPDMAAGMGVAPTRLTSAIKHHLSTGAIARKGTTRKYMYYAPSRPPSDIFSAASFGYLPNDK